MNAPRGRFVLAFAAVTLAGCVRGVAPTRPAMPASSADDRIAAPAADPMTGSRLGARGPERMPIAIGDRWVYTRVYQLSVIAPNGQKRTFFVTHGTITVAMGCVDTMPSGIYAFQHAVEVQNFSNVSNTSVSWTDLREDRTGLYEIKPPNDAVPSCFDASFADARSGARPVTAGPAATTAFDRLPVSGDRAKRERWHGAIRELTRRAEELDRPKRVRPGSRSGEAQLLAYPLHVGQHWSFVDDATGHVLAAHVAAHENCEVPAGRWPAARVVTQWAGHAGVRDTVESWYGSAGLLRYRYHLETAGDPGDPTFVMENEQQLIRVSLPDAPGPRHGH